MKMEFKGYRVFEVQRSSVDEIFNCFNEFKDFSGKEGHISRKISEIFGGNNLKLVEDENCLIDKAISKTWDILNSMNIKTIHAAHIELHQMISHNEDGVKSSFGIHNDGEVDDNIISVLIYLSRDFFGGELVIYHDHLDIYKFRANEIIPDIYIKEVIDTRSSDENLVKIVLLDNNIVHSINKLNGIGSRDLLAVFMGLEKNIVL